MDVAIRDAHLDTSDAALYAWALDEATDGFLRLQFGQRSREIIASASLQPDSEFSLHNVRIAELDGTAVGVCSSFDPASLSRTPSDALSAAAGWTMLRAGFIDLLARPIVRQLDWHDPGDWYVQCLSVRESSRGHGVGTMLLDDARHRAIDAGMEWLTLDVGANNTAARRLYERSGLTVVSTSKPARLLGGIQLHRMAADLLPT